MVSTRAVPATAAAPRPLPSASAFRRRAADVVVIGNSLQAYATAYLLARHGKRAVLVEQTAPELGPPTSSGSGSRPPLALHLPAGTPHLVNEDTEALGLWRGVEAASGARNMLQLCGSIDIAPGGSSTGGDALGAMQEASKAAGLPFGMLAAQEVTTAFPRLRPPRGSASLFTNQGGVLNSQVAAAALLAMAQRARADVAAGRCLLGWRDAGSHFAVRTAANPAIAAALAGGSAGGEEETIFECEQLVLLPEAAVQCQTLAMFGLAVPGAALWRVPAGRWGAPEECASLPVWQLLGTGSRRTVDDPTAVDSCWGLPVLDWGPPGTAFVAQSLTDGDPADEQLEQQKKQQQQTAAAAASAGAAAREVAGPKALEPKEQAGSEEAVDSELARLAQLQRRQVRSKQRLAAAGSLAAGLVNGLGGRLAGNEGALQLIVTPDGESAVGTHPGHEQGRIVAAFPGTAACLGSLPANQLAPLIARLAMNELLGQASEAVDAANVSLRREVLQAEAVELQHDSWASQLVLSYL